MPNARMMSSLYISCTSLVSLCKFIGLDAYLIGIKCGPQAHIGAEEHDTEWDDEWNQAEEQQAPPEPHPQALEEPAYGTTEHIP